MIMVETINTRMTDRPEQGALQILIVEDNRGDVLLVREALRESDLHFELTHVADGQEAFEYLQRHSKPGAPRPDLVLLDLNLPKRDGWEILSEIRGSATLHDTPVIVLSSSGNPDDRDRANRTPGAMYIRKPSTFDEYLNVGRQIESFWHAQQST